MTTTRPIIAIVCCHKLVDSQQAQTVYQKYINAINFYGGNAILLPSTAADTDNFESLMSIIDGVLLTGSYSNVAPERYGATHFEDQLDLGRDELSFKLLAYADKFGLPLLAICRGLQEMNVYFKGTLHADWRDVKGFYEPHLPDSTQSMEVQYQPVHDIVIEKGARLAMFGAEWRVNSVHQQAIDKVGSRLQVEAYARDGLIEAISSPKHPFMIGVQWHPEFNYEKDKLSQFLFSQFIYHASQKNDSYLKLSH